eukprot:comp9021_c0_seq1/m.4214 comp9021_c0_seq1/g.4214  ORF comp9021_c0_seq1/g.4214 comp9021_c0_seq1/m.4214 type:complete len:225 (-) comp9021_c0_seq1:369-1043(-)
MPWHVGLHRAATRQLLRPLSHPSLRVGAVLTAGRLFSASATCYGKAPMFDTHRLVRSLEDRGFNTQQAEALTDALVTILNDSAQDMAASLSKQADVDKFRQQHYLDIDQIKKDIEVLDKTKLVLLKFEIEKIQNELKKLELSLKEEITKMKSTVRLDFSLEKGRTKEEFSHQEQQIKDTRNKIDTEIAHLRTQIEQSKLDFFRYFLGALVSGASLTMAYIRLMK